MKYTQDKQLLRFCIDRTGEIEKCKTTFFQIPTLKWLEICSYNTFKMKDTHNKQLLRLRIDRTGEIEK
jgi:hypothetical protein